MKLLKTNGKPSDPSHFSSLILNQKRYLKVNPDDPLGWVKMGCLYEERVSIADRIVTKKEYLF